MTFCPPKFAHLTMRIVINAAGISDNFRQRELRQYYSECLIRLARAESDSAFWVFPSQFFAGPEWNGVPLKAISLKGGLPFNALNRLWAAKRLGSEILSNKINVALSLGLPTIDIFSIPHFIWIADSESFRVPGKNLRWKKLLLKENVWLLVDSATDKNSMIETYSLKEEKILVVPLAPSETRQPMAWTDKEQIRVKYSGGREYFMARSYWPAENIMVLLKAFSIFKKRQQTNMKLLIAGAAGEPDHTPHEKLESYKYRDDVHAYPGIAEKELFKLEGSAYALIQPVSESSGLSILNAMQSEVPVISARKPDDISGDTILYAEPFGQESMGEALIKLFTNEDMKNELIRKGRVWAAQYSIQQSVGFLCEAFLSSRTDDRH